MISSVSGKVKGISSNSVVIEVGGVGILVNVPLRVIETLSIGNLVDLHTHLIVREDALTLYGFSELADRNLFELLLTVTGVGPKVAQSILGVNPAAAVADMIKGNNFDAYFKKHLIFKINKKIVLWYTIRNKFYYEKSYTLSKKNLVYKNQKRKNLYRSCSGAY
jgi:Holliday junction DNA helicase RuvA subunit